MKTFFVTFFITAASLPLSVLASGFDYKCFSYYWNGYDGLNGTMELSLSASSATADIDNEAWDDYDIGGPIDPDYRSRGSVKYVKFGYNLIVEEVLLSGGKRLKDGSLGGFVRVEGQAEGGFYQYKFICKH